MQTIVIPTSQNIDLEFPVANLGIRIGAALLDQAILVAYIFLSFELLEEFSFDTEPYAFIFIVYLPVGTYSLWCESIFDGQTIGKMVFKLRVVRLDGAAPTLGDYLLRWLIKPVDLYLTNGLAGLISISVTSKGQRLGDLAAGTTVVRLRLVTVFGDTIFRDTGETYQVTYPQVERLRDKDITILKEVMDSGMRSSNEELLERLSQRIKKVTGIQSDFPNRQFLETVLRDYNHIFGQGN